MWRLTKKTARRSGSKSLSTRGASVLTVVTVRHPRLPFGVLWVPCLSFVLYLLAWGARMILRFLPRTGKEKALPLSTARLGWLLAGMAGLVLRSGSYTLLQITGPAGLRVTVRLV
jgi:hypothetical protein